jgi:hypothetical protein
MHVYDVLCRFVLFRINVEWHCEYVRQDLEHTRKCRHRSNESRLTIENNRRWWRMHCVLFVRHGHCCLTFIHIVYHINMWSIHKSTVVVVVIVNTSCNLSVDWRVDFLQMKFVRWTISKRMSIKNRINNDKVSLNETNTNDIDTFSFSSVGINQNNRR